jgi:hypothetical protein
MNETSPLFIKIREDILKKINEGEIHMRSRWYFVIRLTALIMVVFFIVLISSLLFCFILFSLEVSGRLFVLGFGMKGILVFLTTFPWGMLILDILLLLLLKKLLSQFRFGYVYPFAYIFGGILLATGALGTTVYLFSIHMTLVQQVEKNHVPYAESFFVQLRRSPRESGVVRGTVISVGSDRFTLRADGDPSERSLFIVHTPPTLDIGDVLEINDKLFVFGEITEDRIVAYGYRKIIEVSSGR